MDQKEAQELSEIPDEPVSLMEQWDALDEQTAQLKTKADQKLFELITAAHGWIAKQRISVEKES